MLMAPLRCKPDVARNLTQKKGGLALARYINYPVALDSHGGFEGAGRGTFAHVATTDFVGGKILRSTRIMWSTVVKYMARGHCLLGN